MIWEYMQRGMASAGWLVGFVVILGLFLVIVGLLGLAFMTIFGGNEEDEAPEEWSEEREAKLFDDLDMNRFKKEDDL